MSDERGDRADRDEWNEEPGGFTGAAANELGLGETEDTELVRKTGSLPESPMIVVGGVGAGPGIIHPTEGWRRCRHDEVMGEEPPDQDDRGPDW